MRRRCHASALAAVVARARRLTELCGLALRRLRDPLCLTPRLVSEAVGLLLRRLFAAIGGQVRHA